MSTMGNTTAHEPSAGGNAQGASSATEQAKGRVQETAQQAGGQARERLRQQVDQRSTQAGEQVSTTADDVRTVAQQLREQGKDKPAQLAEQAADRVERVGHYLTRSDGEALLRDIEDFGRRQPWAVMFGGLAAGFLASRFLKASSSRRYEARYDRPSGGEPAGPYIRPPATTVGPAPGAGARVTAEPGFADPAIPRPVEDVTLTGDVAPGTTRPGGAL